MYHLKLVFKNIFRHKLRSLLTLPGSWWRSSRSG